LQLLPQTRRHSLLVNLLRVPSVVFAINKLDAVADAALAYKNIAGALNQFAKEAGITIAAMVPVSALKGWNVVTTENNDQSDWCGYTGPSLLSILEDLPVTPAETDVAFSFPVQWVEKFHDSGVTTQGRRVFWGRVATGSIEPGQTVKVFPSGQTAVVSQVLSATRQAQNKAAGHSAGIVLDREVDVSRGDWLLAAHGSPEGQRQLGATIAWMDDEPLVAGRLYWALHGHRWVKVKVQHLVHRLNVNTLAEEEATELPPNAIGHVTLTLQEPLAALPFAQSRILGALVLVDTASHKTSGAVLVN
jgi:sulfate adenylyltransferase subunit 1